MMYVNGPDPRLFGGNGAYGMPQGGMGLPGQPFGGPGMTMPQGPQQGVPGGWMSALGRATGLSDMSGAEKAYLGLSAIGGVADWWERKKAREEEQRRYEQALEESRRHRSAMGASWNATYGGA